MARKHHANPYSIEVIAGFPLRKSVLVAFKRKRSRVSARLDGVSEIAGIQGVGADEKCALRELEKQFKRLIYEKVRIPPHEQKKQDEPICKLVNSLVNWEEFNRQNPSPEVLWGQIIRKSRQRLPVIRWLIGPAGIRDKTTRLPEILFSPHFAVLPKSAWFHAVVQRYPQGIQWIEPPHRVPDPTNENARRKAWAKIPIVLADDPDAWPLNSDAICRGSVPSAHSSQ